MRVSSEVAKLVVLSVWPSGETGGLNFPAGVKPCEKVASSNTPLSTK